jgi:hypothetical protein
VLLDLSSAFDTIDHKTIVDVLEYQFVVADKAIEWQTRTQALSATLLAKGKAL